MKLVIDIPEGHYNSIVGGHDIEIYYGEHFVTKDSWASELIRKGTPLEPQIFKWCRDCREYDQEKHCCHRWSKVIRDTVEEMKQEYIEREVLDKISAEIEELYSYVEFDEDIKTSFNMVRLEEVQRVIDKYKAETEDRNA